MLMLQHHVDADKNIGKEIGGLYGCVTCHGGYPRGLTSKVPHKGAFLLIITLSGECYGYA